MIGALQKHREVHAPPGDRFFYLLNSFCIARILDDLGNPQEALAELRSSLETAEGPPSQSDLRNLILYTDLAERLGQDLPRPFLETAQKVVHLWRVPLADDELTDRRKVVVALRAADQKARAGAPKRPSA